MDLGFERAGIPSVLQCEIDDHCRAVLARHWPEVERIEDVRDVSMERPQQPGDDGEFGRDLVFGGFPCQDISVAGRRGGLAAERSGLWFEFRRILFELRPRWAVIENVPGLLSSNGGRDFATILDGLEECGFEGISWAILDSQFFGVPQRRRRVFIVCGPDRRSSEAVLDICERCEGHPPPGRAEGERPSRAFAVRTANTGANGHGVADDVAHTLDGASGQAITGNADNDQIVPSLQERDGKGTDGRAAKLISPTVSAKWHNGSGGPAGDEHQNLVVGALNVEMYYHGGYPNQTMNSDNGHVQVARQGVRRLTPLECERLMGWPDDWTRWRADGSEVSDSHRYKMCGNGVVSTVAEWIRRRILAVDAWE